MSRILTHFLFVVVAIAFNTLSIEAQDKPVREFPEPIPCTSIETIDAIIENPRYQGEPDWGPCEYWAWSCIAEGREANFFNKQCVVPRTTRSSKLRKLYKYAPFFEPDKYKTSNKLDPRFINTLLENAQYRERIPAVGIRLIGAYFVERVNLENLSTVHNLVIDQSILKAGLRLTNFKTERNLSLDGSNIRYQVRLLRAHIGGTLFMDEGVYDQVDAGDARIGGSLDAPSSIFNAPIFLDRVKVGGKVSLIGTRLTEFTAFDTTIGSKMELAHAQVRGRIDLSGSHIEGDLRLQRLRFGRALAGHETLFCDWQHDFSKDHFLHPDYLGSAGRTPIYDAILQESVYSRPIYKPVKYPCLKHANWRPVSYKKSQPYHHEVILRDMKIGGTLCLIDITGAIDQPQGGEEGEAPKNLRSITLDGSQARSTIVRWAPSDSLTLWQAVHFRTNNLFIDLGNSPKRHFFDNLGIGNVSFLRPISQQEQAPHQARPTRSYLCEVPTGTNARFASDSLDTHKRIVSFFKSEGNLSRSAQPFGEIVSRLNESNASSMKLKMEFSDYKLRKACTASEYYKNQTEAGFGWPDLEAFSLSKADGAQIEPINELRNIVLDTACLGALKAYRFSVAYGHQPHNILIIMGVFVLIFWALMRLDKPLPQDHKGPAPPKLGLLYSIDMFTPFVKLDRKHSEWKPNRRPLRAYLVFHRVIGLILTGLLGIGIYAARF